MGSSSDFFNLTWNEFQTTVATSFHDLRSNEEFLDVTLAIDQDHQCQAHKVILSASSPYFRSVLRRNQTAPNPVLIMPANVRYNDLRALLDFVYQGEVKIPTNELEEFLALAKLLKIKGLTEKTEDEANKKPIIKPQQPIMKMTPGNQGPPPPQMGGRRRPSGGQQSQHPGQTPPPQSSSVGGAPPQPKRHRPEQKFAPMPPQSQPGQGNVVPPNDELDEDDVHELDEEGNAMYGEYEDYEGSQDYNMASEADQGPGQPGGPNQQPPQQQQKQSGPVLSGLLCPMCRVLVPGADALTAHMYASHGVGGGGESAGGKGRGKGGKGSRGGKGGRQHQPPGADGEPEDKPHACHICDKPFKTQQYVKNHIKRVHKPHMDEEMAPEEDHSEGMLMDDTGMIQGPSSMHAKASPVKKKGRPAKNPEMPPHMHRPIGQVSPAPRSSNEGKEGHEPSRPPVQQDRASPMMQRPGGGHRPMMPGGPKRQPGMGGPSPGFMGPGMRLRGPAPHHQQQYQSGPPHQGIDVKRLGLKLGGGISISSSGDQQQQPIAPSTSRRMPMPGPSRMHSSSPKSDPLATSNRPSVSRQSNLSQDISPVEVKQEPMDDMFEEGEELPEDEEDFDEEDYGEEEEEEGYVPGDPGAPYDDDGVEYEDDDDGSYHQQ